MFKPHDITIGEQVFRAVALAETAAFVNGRYRRRTTWLTHCDHCGAPFSFNSLERNGTIWAPVKRCEKHRYSAAHKAASLRAEAKKKAKEEREKRL